MLGAPPQIGDRVVLGDWYQFKSHVTCVEDLDDCRVCLHVTIEYPENDPFFKRSREHVKVYLKDEGETWHRYSSHPKLN
jgi:hypothetical protein